MSLNTPVNQEGLSILAGSSSASLDPVMNDGPRTMRINEMIPPPPPGFPPMAGPNCYVSYAYFVTCPKEDAEEIKADLPTTTSSRRSDFGSKQSSQNASSQDEASPNPNFLDVTPPQPRKCRKPGACRRKQNSGTNLNILEATAP